MSFLLIDTSSYATVILVDFKGNIISEYTSQSANKHVEELCDIVLQTLKQAKTSFQELQHVFVIDFPGGYTSIRIGISFANALKFIIQKPVTALSKLDIIRDTRKCISPCVIIYQNKLDEYFISILKDNINAQVSLVNKKEAMILQKNYNLVGQADFLEDVINVSNQEYAEFALKFLQKDSIKVNNNYLKTSHYTYQKYTKMSSFYDK